MNNKIYRSNEEGKREFIDDVINSFVQNEGHFKMALYVTNNNGEYINLYKQGEPNPVYAIDITADSIEAITVDFCNKFAAIIKKEMY